MPVIVFNKRGLELALEFFLFFNAFLVFDIRRVFLVLRNACILVLFHIVILLKTVHAGLEKLIDRIANVQLKMAETSFDIALRAFLYCNFYADYISELVFV